MIDRDSDSGNKNSAPGDADLMARVRDGDQTAFETLLRRHEDPVFRLAARIIGRRDVARDVVQDIFLGVWENPHKWKPTAKFTTWLYRVTFNRALNEKRALKLKSMFSLSGVKDLDSLDFSDQIAMRENPESQLESHERSRIAAVAFSKLNPRQAAALHLRYSEELSVSDIAKSMDVTYKSVESLIFRGKVKLRKLVKEAGGA